MDAATLEDRTLSLPWFLLRKILTYLDYESYQKCREVCTLWRDMLASDSMVKTEDTRYFSNIWMDPTTLERRTFKFQDLLDRELECLHDWNTDGQEFVAVGIKKGIDNDENKQRMVVIFDGTGIRDRVDIPILASTNHDPDVDAWHSYSVASMRLQPKLISIRATCCLIRHFGICYVDRSTAERIPMPGFLEDIDNPVGARIDLSDVLRCLVKETHLFHSQRTIYKVMDFVYGQDNGTELCQMILPAWARDDYESSKRLFFLPGGEYIFYDSRQRRCLGMNNALNGDCLWFWQDDDSRALLSPFDFYYQQHDYFVAHSPSSEPQHLQIRSRRDGAIIKTLLCRTPDDEQVYDERLTVPVATSKNYVVFTYKGRGINQRPRQNSFVSVYNFAEDRRYDARLPEMDHENYQHVKNLKIVQERLLVIQTCQCMPNDVSVEEVTWGMSVWLADLWHDCDILVMLGSPYIGATDGSWSLPSRHLPADICHVASRSPLFEPQPPELLCFKGRAAAFDELFEKTEEDQQFDEMLDECMLAFRWCMHESQRGP